MTGGKRGVFDALRDSFPDSVSDELHSAAQQMRGRVTVYDTAVAELLELIAARHPHRVGAEVTIGHGYSFRPIQYCGACHDRVPKSSSWPCEQVRQALAVARALDKPDCRVCHGTPPPGFACTECGTTTTKEPT